MPGRTVHPFPEGMLTWTTTEPARGPLRDHGFAVLPWATLLERFVARARVGGARTSLGVPAAPLLARYAEHPAVAVLGVRLEEPEALRTLHDFVLRPAWQAGCRLLVHADRQLAELGPVDEPGYGHPFTLERALRLTRVMAAARGPAPSPGRAAPSRPLDPEQLRAVEAGDGVVQVIAPAGSGKTTVLVERVRELLRRGVPAEQVLCTTFNKDAALELRARLTQAGVAGVQARTFHAVGRMLLAEEELLRGSMRTPSLGQWRRFCAQASRRTGTWVDPADAREAIGQIKLVHLATAAEWAATEPADKTVAEVHRLLEAHHREQGTHDFDDLVMLAVRALRSDAALRERWQRRFSRVLVDEHQDIEPAQELLVQLLAAPEDSLFAVGDEDQTLYGWRRASVARIVGLDQTYPSLQRVALRTNYRCPPEVVSRSAQLIARNALRFPKPIEPAPGRAADPASVKLMECASPEAAAEWTAELLAGAGRGEVVVLARTTRGLRTVALACIEPGVRIAAPSAIFEAQGAQAAVEAHLRLATAPLEAEPEDVLTVLRNPGRGLPLDGEREIASRLRAGRSWRAACAGGEARLLEAAGVLDQLARIEDARAFVRRLRGPFGLDAHFAEHERTFGGVEQVETEALADAERSAAGHTVASFRVLLVGRREALLALRDDEAGIELTTVHRAKGREWPTVVLVGMDVGQLPHAKALEVTREQAAAGEGEEAERRVAYVALTRAKERLVVCHTTGKLSPFAWQAGLAPMPSPRAEVAPALAGSRREGRPSNFHQVQAKRDARSRIRAAADQEEGLALAAIAVEGKLGDVSRLALVDLIIEAPSTSSALIRELLAPCGVDPSARVGALSVPQRRGVAAALRTPRA